MFEDRGPPEGAEEVMQLGGGDNEGAGIRTWLIRNPFYQAERDTRLVITPRSILGITWTTCGSQSTMFERIS